MSEKQNESNSHNCPDCGGVGETIQFFHGSGNEYHTQCSKCGGSGRVSVGQVQDWILKLIDERVTLNREALEINISSGNSTTATACRGALEELGDLKKLITQNPSRA